MKILIIKMWFSFELTHYFHFRKELQEVHVHVVHLSDQAAENGRGCP
jgi:hypothetical protein